MVRLFSNLKKIINSETVYEEVIKQIKINDNYLYEKVEKAIEEKCGRNKIKIKELYAEVCCENERVGLLGLFVAFCAFLIAVVAMIISAIKELKLNQLIIIIVGALIIIAIVENYVIYDWDKYRYRHYVINILKEKYKNIIE